MVATCRRTGAGGKFPGTVEEQLAVLGNAVRAGCQMVDLEFESLRGRNEKELARDLRPARLIISYHTFRKRERLELVYRRLLRSDAAIIKIAAQAHELRDNLKIFKLLRSHRQRRPRLVALAMGPAGIPSRILGLQRGSYLTYASADSRIRIASGQIAADSMRTSYRVEHLNGKTLLYGIVGSHASASLSPVMQNAALHAKRINAVYVPYEAQRLVDFLSTAKDLGLEGFSVTMPFKREILKHLDWIDPLAEKIGAVNTVAVRRGKWFGWNTDAAAVVEVLTKRIRLSGSRALVLGSGGAARAAAHALKNEGANVFISARRNPAGTRLARAIRAQSFPWGSTDSLEVDAVINATPVGMPPLDHLSPIDLSRLRTRVVSTWSIIQATAENSAVDRGSQERTDRDFGIGNAGSAGCEPVRNMDVAARPQGLDGTSGPAELFPFQFRLSPGAACRKSYEIFRIAPSITRFWVHRNRPCKPLSAHERPSTQLCRIHPPCETGKRNPGL